MALPRFSSYSLLTKFIRVSNVKQITRSASINSERRGALPSGALLPEPKKVPFGLLGIICMVVPGLFIGAAISKYMANFLEENELFVPSDDDDDDD